MDIEPSDDSADEDDDDNLEDNDMSSDNEGNAVVKFPLNPVKPDMPADVVSIKKEEKPGCNSNPMELCEGGHCSTMGMYLYGYWLSKHAVYKHQILKF